MDDLLNLFGFGEATHTAYGKSLPQRARSKAQYAASELKREKAIAHRNKRKAAKKANRGNQHS